MKLTDTIKLATKGFKPADIKRFDENGLDVDTVLSLSGAGYSASDVDELINMASKEQEPQEPKEQTAKTVEPDGARNVGAKPDDVDYKKELEDTKKELASVQEQLKRVQDLNASRSLTTPPQKSPREMVDDVLRGIY